MRIDCDETPGDQAQSARLPSGRPDSLAASSCAKAAVLDALIESDPDLIARYDLQCRRTQINPAMQATFGRPLEQILGRTPEDLPLLGTRPFMEILRGVITRGQGWDGDLACRDGEGRIVCGNWRLIPEFDVANKLLAVWGIWHDATKLRELDRQLHQVQRLAVLGELVSGVAHDFNNVLAAIVLHINLVHADLRLPRDLAEMLEELEADARRATSLPRQLLRFSRDEPMPAQPIFLEDVVDRAVRMLRRILGKHVQLEFRPAAKRSQLCGDGGMLEQMVFNLCLNARDAMSQGGRIMLTTRMVDVGHEYVRKNKAARAGRFVRFCVADDGCGMEAGTLSRIFEPFFTTKPAGRGTGLGLAIVSDIVKRHRGWIEVESIPRRGTSFFVFLPVDGRNQTV